MQDKIDEVELQNEKLRTAYESLKNEVAALQSGAISRPPKCEESDGAFPMGHGQVPSLDYLSFNTGVYHTGGNQGFGWGLGS